ncbi:LacI family DNA-binding transcriptional regulator [Microbacterium sp. VKM Ac-2923]|uniref:LacI family DNA-binding transcriptional regulator n=1 Tax=Microbacterium sp. VKM Ac-2923 TaxID=2929476 RepID=UPI001FB4ADD4|nr:LacI family DNA-binding transcriptional regulator [Microbacterium sp. VKM Ac-2923]MCJ1709008.1 LacI family DNA-binding transcriptional regulator [Microbacterium sp. VKM Ac-2923]
MASRPSRPVGIEDVARAASVSITTVSHALSGKGQVAAATRARVADVARELGYAPNRHASALRGRRTHILGFVSDNIATTPFATRVIVGAQEAAAERDQLLVVVNSNEDEDIEARQISSLLAARVDAVVYARMFHHDATTLPEAMRGVPSVMVDTADTDGRVPSVVPDETQIGRLATEALVAAGHRHIAHLTIDQPGRGTDLREEGYRSVLADAGLSPLVIPVPGDADAAAGREAWRRLRSVSDEVTGVFCFNDPLAMGVYQAANIDGLSIPEDLSVIGVDDFRPVAEALLPGLTTVALPHYEMGRWAVNSLLHLLDGGTLEGPVDHVIPGALVTRGSVRPPRA